MSKRLTLPDAGTLDVTIPPGLLSGQILLDQVHGLRYALAQLRSGSRTDDSESPRDGKQM